MGHPAAKVLMDGYWAEVEKAGLDDNPYRAGFAQIVVVADSDAQAEKLYLQHLRNFYAKALFVNPGIAAVPGVQTLASYKHGLMTGAGSYRGGSRPTAPEEMTWADFTDKSKRVIGGSPDTVVAGIEEAVRNLRIGHLLVLLQIQSMDHELTKYNMRTFAEKVLPRISGIWDKEGYQDHWWPQGAARGNRHLDRNNQARIPAGATA
jgi:alkanesulfonate monooxygenase SsuD/methylene tetrahydromethanopterin reductase-like flavin-dependent oxidoreductase (luciferase family)